MPALEEGQVAPDFTLPSTDNGKPIRLKDLRGRNVILYFYPKDDTPGCTAEACAFRDTFPKFQHLDAVIIGVSPDDLASHEKFRAKYQLPFTLLADADHAVAERYGVWKEKKNYGKTYMGIERTTFVIDGSGKIAKIFPKVKVEGHEAALLEVLQASA